MCQHRASLIPQSIELHGAQTLRQAHDIGAALRRAILAAYPQCDVIIHKDVYHPQPQRAPAIIRTKRRDWPQKRRPLAGRFAKAC